MPLFRQLYRRYPAFVEDLRTRAERYNRCREELFALEAEGKVLVIAPADTRGFSRTERDLHKILVPCGRTATLMAAGPRMRSAPSGRRRCRRPGREPAETARQARRLPRGRRRVFSADVLHKAVPGFAHFSVILRKFCKNCRKPFHAEDLHI